MNLLDNTGQRLSGADTRSLDLYQQAVHELLCMVDDPAATAQAAIDASADLTMAHVLLAWLNLLGTEPSGLDVARAHCAAAATLAADDREKAHLAAALALTRGHWREAGLRLEDLSARFPLDALALFAGHQIDFMRGDSRMLRDRIARVLPAWDKQVPGWHAVLGMYAFGLEETGDYAGAQTLGQRAVEIEPRDSWAWHAVAHVHEMRQATRDGIAWLAPTRATWSGGSFLATHNTWHLALLQLELDQVDEVLRLYDEAIGGTGSSVVLDLVDASSMLWRLYLRGVPLGERFGAIADRWLAVGGAGQYAFNDLHAMFAFVGADHQKAQQTWIDAQREAMQSERDNAEFARAVGHPAALAVQAFGQGDHARATQLLRALRSAAHRFGGSHAQRDVIDLTLLESAFRSGDRALSGALAAERLACRPHSPLARRYTTRTHQPMR